MASRNGFLYRNEHERNGNKRNNFRQIFPVTYLTEKLCLVPTEKLVRIYFYNELVGIPVEGIMFQKSSFTVFGGNKSKQHVLSSQGHATVGTHINSIDNS